MKNIGVILLTGLLSCGQAQTRVEVIKFADLDEIIKADQSDILVLNFWATWCAPCVKELHQFEQLLKDHNDKNIAVVLVSFDFSEQLESKVIPFVKKKNLQSRVVLLDETDYDSFINRIDPEWSGAIPATLMVDNRNGNRDFFEQEFKEGELERTFVQFIN